MKRSLLRLGVILSLAVPVPVPAQYIYMDTNGDAFCTNADIVTASTQSLDVYLDTNHDREGRLQTCNTNSDQPLNIFSYDLLFNAQMVQGSLTYDSWTNALDGFSLLNPLTVAGPDAGVGFTGTTLPPGLYKLGTLHVTVSGVGWLFFRGTSPTPDIPSPVTGFGSSCDASEFGNTMTLGVDFYDNCGTSGAFTDGVEATTWGKIKQIYH